MSCSFENLTEYQESDYTFKISTLMSAAMSKTRQFKLRIQKAMRKETIYKQRKADILLMGKTDSLVKLIHISGGKETEDAEMELYKLVGHHFLESDSQDSSQVFGSYSDGFNITVLTLKLMELESPCTNAGRSDADDICCLHHILSSDEGELAGAEATREERSARSKILDVEVGAAFDLALPAQRQVFMAFFRGMF